MKRRIHPVRVEQGVAGIQETLIHTWCVTGLQSSRAVLVPSNLRSVLLPPLHPPTTRHPSPEVDTTDWTSITRVL